MKVLMLTMPQRVERYSAREDIPGDWELVYMGAEAGDGEILASAADADFIFADAMRPVSGELIRAMPRLRLIHSEGAGFSAIDGQAARERGIAVCNCPGMNATAVAEQTVLLMLGVLRRVWAGQQAVLRGGQIDFKLAFSGEGIRELGEMSVGFVGFGAIAQQTARLLKAFGCRMFYHSRSGVSPELELELGVERLEPDELYAACHIISLHVPAAPETIGMINAQSIGKMRDGAIIINTARGEIIRQEDMLQALLSGKLGGVGLDVFSPEPVREGDPLLGLPEQVLERVVLSPHIGGITVKGFTAAHRHIWKNLRAVARGESPMSRVI